VKCSAEWREDDGELARCELEEGHSGPHRFRNVLPPVVVPIERCPKCGELACLHKTLAGVEFVGDRAAGVVRFKLRLPNGVTVCAAIPAVEAVDVADELARAAKEALR
jgi:hypothetical protein